MYSKLWWIRGTDHEQTNCSSISMAYTCPKRSKVGRRRTWLQVRYASKQDKVEQVM